MTTLTAPTPSPIGTRSGPQAALGVVGLALTANALVLGSLIFFDSRDYSEVAGTWLHLAHYAVLAACLVTLSQVFPRLTGLRGADGRNLPAGLLRLAGVAAAFGACAMFTQAFATAYLADAAPTLLDSAPGAILMVPMLAVSAAVGLAIAALGLVAGRRGVVPWPAAVLLVLGGLAQPAIGPLAYVFAGAGLVWTASRGASDLPGVTGRA